MDRLKSLWPPTHAYKEVRTSQSDDDERQSEGSEENLREQIATLEGNVWCLRVSLLITVVALMLVTVFAVFDRVTSVRDAHNCGHIGSDHSGFVPPGKNAKTRDWEDRSLTVPQKSANQEDGQFSTNLLPIISRRTHFTT